MNSEDFPLVCISGLCFGPHPKVGRFLQSLLLQKHHLGLTEGRGAVSLWNVVRDQPGQERRLQMLSWLRACEPNTRMATETQMVGAATATGLWSRGEHGVLFTALSFFFSPHFCPL